MKHLYLSRHVNSRLPWWLIIAVAWLMVISQADIRQAIDEQSSGYNWLRAEISIEPGKSPPLIRYKAHATRSVDGIWNAKIFLADGTRFKSRKGTGHYVPNDRPPRLWTWQEFFGNGWEAAPPEPDEPYMICVDYRMTALRSGVRKDSPQFCSPIYDPNGKD